jgi:NosR/NirI family nitrous oxide reductase transcriptional regulator
MNFDLREIPPPYARNRGMRWLLSEIVDHLWPWTRQGWVDHKLLESVGIAVALAATLAWGLAAYGNLEHNVVIVCWLGWSVYEIIIRLQCKCYIKSGPWWGHHYRRAGVMDMICYVLFKNLLIGVVLFVVLHHFGLLLAAE